MKRKGKEKNYWLEREKKGKTHRNNIIIYSELLMTTDPSGSPEFSFELKWTIVWSDVIKVTDQVKRRSKFAQILSVR